jgi:phage tail sheath protein FI
VVDFELMGRSMGERITLEDIDSASVPSISAAIARELLEGWCATHLLWVTFETANVPPLWSQVTRQIHGYLTTLWLTGMLCGDTAKESFVVTCDQTTMTQADMNEGHLICQVGLAPVKPSEFIYYRIRIQLKYRQPPQSERSWL